MQLNEVISVCVCVLGAAGHRKSLGHGQMLIPPGCDNYFMTLYASGGRCLLSAQFFFIWLNGYFW